MVWGLSTGQIRPLDPDLGRVVVTWGPWSPILAKQGCCGYQGPDPGVWGLGGGGVGPWSLTLARQRQHGSLHGPHLAEIKL